MALMDGTLFSKVLNRETHFRIALPQDSRARITGTQQKNSRTEKAPRTLILLHGYSGSYSTWTDYTSLARYAAAHNIAVVMPDGIKSLYSDMVYGEQFFRFITEELAETCSAMFHISTDPKSLMIAGNSMGGYGALRCALTYPERYFVCGAFSAAADLKKNLTAERMENIGSEAGRCMQAVLGETLEVPDHMDIFSLAEKLREKAEHLMMYHTCGRQDFLYSDNLRLRSCLENQQFKDYRFDEMEGVHDWAFWDKAIENFMEYCDRPEQ